MTEQEALDLVRDVLAGIVPDADFARIGPDARLRAELELDSMDFLSFVVRLSARTGRRIDEDDYPQLETLARAAAFLARP